MNALPITYTYAGHTVAVHRSYVSLYQHFQLIGNYKTEAAARAQASRLHKIQRAADAAEHHNRILQIWS